MDSVKSKGGWYNREGRIDSIRHGLAAKGIRTKRENRDYQSERIRSLAQDGSLTWKHLYDEYGKEEAEEMLNKYLDQGSIELDELEESDGTRLRLGCASIELEDDDGETTTYVISPDTHIKFVKG